MTLVFSVIHLIRKIVFFGCRKCKRIGYNLRYFVIWLGDAMKRVSKKHTTIVIAITPITNPPLRQISLADLSLLLQLLDGSW